VSASDTAARETCGILGQSTRKVAGQLQVHSYSYFSFSDLVASPTSLACLRLRAPLHKPQSKRYGERGVIAYAAIAASLNSCGRLPLESLCVGRFVLKIENWGLARDLVTIYRPLPGRDLMLPIFRDRFRRNQI
jgi:hypothetical protein